jgi:hypothetical protein
VSERRWIEGVLGKLGLTLSATKTRVVSAWGTTFDFLGHTIRFRYGRVYLDIRQKVQERIRDAIRSKTRHVGPSVDEMVAEMNPYIRGVRRYFRRVVTRRLAKLDRFVLERFARWSARKHSHRRPAWSLVRGGALWKQHGLERFYIPRGVARTTSRTSR